MGEQSVGVHRASQTHTKPYIALLSHVTFSLVAAPAPASMLQTLAAPALAAL